MFRYIAVFIFAFGFAQAAAFAQSCSEIAVSLSKQTAALAADAKQLKTMAAKVEALGEEWENSAALAAISTKYNEEARTKEQSYENLKIEFQQAQTLHLNRADALNAAIASFNASCAKPDKQ